MPLMVQAISIASSENVRPVASDQLVEAVDRLRSEAFGKSSTAQRSLLGQFPTPTSIAHFMA
ncbi:MAG TPA: hypothetical protein VFC46_17135, partial [Humisphaera sp.]|nr:hypothetical protein [Humisphaera sp.]